MMRPIDFVVVDGDSSPNTPAISIAEAIMSDLIIRGSDCEYIVLSYYYDETEHKMVLDIEKK